MSENNKHPSAGRGRKRAGWFRRLFFGGSKTLADDMLETDRYGQQKIEDVEVILSPGKQIAKGFFEKKYAVVALVVVVVMFLIAFVGPLFMPKYFDAYSENTQQSIYPTLSMSRIRSLSLLLSASIMTLPMPLMANICSMTTEPEKIPRNQPTTSVTMGISALRQACE